MLHKVVATTYLKEFWSILETKYSERGSNNFLNVSTQEEASMFEENLREETNEEASLSQVELPEETNEDTSMSEVELLKEKNEEKYLKWIEQSIYDDDEDGSSYNFLYQIDKLFEYAGE
jgi:hypothetical protein